MPSNRRKLYARISGPSGYVNVYRRKKDAVRGNMSDCVFSLFAEDMSMSSSDIKINQVYELSITLTKTGGILDTVS